MRDAILTDAVITELQESAVLILASKTVYFTLCFKIIFLAIAAHILFFHQISHIRENTVIIRHGASRGDETEICNV